MPVFLKNLHLHIFFQQEKLDTNIEKKYCLAFHQIFELVSSHFSQKSASDCHFIFFAHFVLQKLKLDSQINIPSKKVATDLIAAGC